MDRNDIQNRLFRALAWGLERIGEANVWLMFQQDLRQALTPHHARLSLTIELADPSHMDEIASLYHADDPQQAARAANGNRARLRIGALCFLARHDGHIVAFDWLRSGYAVGAAEVRMVLKDDEVYCSDAFTCEAWRGHGIHPALNYAMLSHAQRQGYRMAYTLARADNAASLATLRRLGWAQSGTLLIFEPAWAPDKPIWLAGGSPYPMPVAGLASLRLPTITELFEQQKFDSRELIKSRPWSRSYCLRRGDARFHLKIVPREHAAGLKAAAAVAGTYPEHVPGVVACNAVFGSWLLTHDHGGAALDDDSPRAQLMKMLETYADLQVRSAAKPELLKSLPQAPVDGGVQALLDFLGSDAGGEGPGPAGAALFLGAAEARRNLDAVSRARARLEAHLAPARELPITLNHGNLRPAHAALTDGGDCRLFNWTRAMAGPAGLSLHALPRERLPWTVLLGTVAGQAHHGIAEDPLLSHYVETLVRGGYADEETLHRCLPASISAGIVLDALHMAGYPMEDPVELQIVSDHLGQKLDRVLELCDRLGDAGANDTAARAG